MNVLFVSTYHLRVIQERLFVVQALAYAIFLSVLHNISDTYIISVFRVYGIVDGSCSAKVSHPKFDMEGYDMPTV